MTSIPFIIQLLLKGLVFYGIYILIKPIFIEIIKDLNSKQSKRAEIRKKLTGIQDNSIRVSAGIQRHFEDMLILVEKDYEPKYSYYRFVFRTLFVGAISFVMGYLVIQFLNTEFTDNPFRVMEDESQGNKSNLRFSYFTSSIGLIIPYLILKYRHIRAYTKASYDLIEPIKLITKYSHLKIGKALSETSTVLPEDNVLKKPLKILAMSFGSYASQKELVLAATRFSNLIGTTFAAQFTNNLLYAEREGTENLKSDFLFLYDTMESQRETIIDVKANSRDAIQMGLYINIFSFLLLTGTLISFLTPRIYLKLQFETTIGLTFFTIIMASFVISFVIAILLARPKLDY